MTPSKIFVGSSSEAEKLAKAVGKLIDDHEGTKTLLWRDVFPAGDILLEHIERLPTKIVGAVLLATPDLKCRRNGKSKAAPVANIIFEYGYLSARLGRNRVSILQVDDADLPSDLQGVTVIRDNQRPYQKGTAFPLLESTKRDLRRWLDQLPRLAPSLPAMSQVHGYSGTWDVRNQFTRWRERDLASGDQVYFIGKTLLVFESDGKRGCGIQIGKTHVSIGGYSVIREVVNEVLTAAIDGDGTLRLGLKLIRSRIVPGTERGAKDADPRFREDLVNKEFSLVLIPEKSETATLRGPHEYERGADDKAQLAIEKFVHAGLFGAVGLDP